MAGDAVACDALPNPGLLTIPNDVAPSLAGDPKAPNPPAAGEEFCAVDAAFPKLPPPNGDPVPRVACFPKLEDTPKPSPSFAGFPNAGEDPNAEFGGVGEDINAGVDALPKAGLDVDPKTGLDPAPSVGFGDEPKPGLGTDPNEGIAAVPLAAVANEVLCD